MSINYREIIINLKNYLENSFSDIKIQENFDIDVKVFEKGYKKNSDEKICEKISQEWLNNIEIYDSDTTCLYEKITFFKYNGEDDRKGHYMIYSSPRSLKMDVIKLKPFIEKSIDLDIGIFLALFNNRNSYPNINNNLELEEVKNILELEYYEYANYDFNEILRLFNKINVYKINCEFCDEENSQDHLKQLESFKYRLMGIMKCNEKLENISLERYFSKECIKVYKEVFMDTENINFPYENLYLSLIHNHPKFCFLEVYRILEKLYPIIYCHKLKKELDINEDILSINSLFGEQLKFKPREKDSIKSIFEYAKENSFINKHIKKLDKYKTEVDLANEKTELSKWIYQIRNNSVHLSFSKNKWIDIKNILNKDIIVKELIYILKELYIDIFKEY